MASKRQPDFLIKFARQNRSSLTLPEKLLWKRLKASSNSEFKIKRQYPVLGKYIIDFFYEDLQLAIEVDGGEIHALNWENDLKRQQEIESTGVAFLRLSARYVLQDPDAAADLVLKVCRGEISLEELD